MLSRVTTALVAVLAGVLLVTGAPSYASAGTGASGGEDAARDPAPPAGTTGATSGRRAPLGARAGCPSGQFEVRGRGYGHGRGMSQYGARGRAGAGHGYRRILRFYYPGTDLGRAGHRIRVLLTRDTDRDVVVDNRSRLRLYRYSDGKAWSLNALRPSATRWRMVRNAHGRLVIQFRKPGTGWRVVMRFGSRAEFHAGGKPVRLITRSGARPYRGSLTLHNGDTVNRIRLETYLRGVVPGEMPASWHGRALRAQAVAARTYAARERADAPSRRHFHVYDDTRSQVYGGSAVEHRRTNAAIRDTVWEIRVHDGRPAFTQFSASNGGWTVGVHGFPYLAARVDRFDRYPAWSVCASKSRVAGIYGVGAFRGVRVTERDGNGNWNGRALTVRVTGSERTVWVNGTDFRFAVGLKSNWIVFA